MTVTYHRFPVPAKTDVTKARAWATYCWPSKDWTSVEALQALHLANKVLCGRHFASTQFYDNNRQKLSKFAVPQSIETEEVLSEDIMNQNIKRADAAEQQRSQVPFLQFGNMQTDVFVEPSTKGVRQNRQQGTENEQNIKPDNEERQPNQPAQFHNREKTTHSATSAKSRGILGSLNIERKENKDLEK